MRKLLLPVLFVGLFSASSAALADHPDKEAKAAFDSAVKLFHKENYLDASLEFRRANALKPSFSILYNIGQSEAAARRYGLAFEAFEEYISLGGDEITDERRAEVVQELERLSKVIGSIEVTAPAGSVVYVDEMERGTAPLPGKIRVAIGVVHKVEIARDGETLHSEDIKVSYGEVLRVAAADRPTPRPVGAATTARQSGEVAPLKETRAPEAEEAAPDTGRSYKLVETAGWVSAASGGAMLVGAIVTGALALKKNASLNGECADSLCSKSEKGELFARDNLALSTDMLIGLGATAAVVGGVLVIWSRKKSRGGERVGVAAAPIFGKDVAGIGVSGAF